jgi:hypothetical protein
MLIVLHFLTIGALVYVWLSGGHPSRMVPTLIVIWQIVLCSAISADCWALRFLPAFAFLGVVAITSTTALYLLSTCTSGNQTAISFSGRMDAIPLVVLSWVIALVCRWAMRRQHFHRF